MHNKIFVALVLILNFAVTNLSFAQDAADPYEDEFAAYEAEFNNSNQEEIYDPLEKVNRKVFAFNDFVDRYLVEHIARGYRNYVPQPVRKSVHNFVTNLNLPISAVNSFLQGKVENGLATTSHFLINTTLGVGGLFDVVGTKNIRYNSEDFGQTFGYYGMKSGPYLMLPFLGPSTGRDLSGFAVSVTVDPLSFNQLKVGGSADAVSDEARIGNTLLYSLDLRESLLDPISDLRKDSFDLYATIRSVYTQQRNSDIQR